MVKKKTTKQNVAIIVLSILLLVSIAFGVTYSIFSGSSDELTSGSITTATLTVGIQAVPDDTLWKPEDEYWQNSSSFQLHTAGNILPGQPLENTALQVGNTSPVPTYMVVIYTLEISNDTSDPDEESFIQADGTMDVMDLKADAVGSDWVKKVHICNDGASKIHSLVYLGNNGNGNGIFPAAVNNQAQTSLALHAGSLKVPTSWQNDMQGKSIRVNFVAHVIQAEALSETYPDVVNQDANVRAEGILKSIITEFNLDNTLASN